MATFEPELNQKMDQAQAKFDRALWSFEHALTEKNFHRCLDAQRNARSALSALYGKCYYHYADMVFAASRRRFYIAINSAREIGLKID